MAVADKGNSKAKLLQRSAPIRWEELKELEDSELEATVSSKLSELGDTMSSKFLELEAE